MSCTPTLPTADEARRDVKLAAELEGLSVEELTRKGATIYARQLLAKRDVLPLLRPAPWRQFRLEDGGTEVSFRVRIPTGVFAQAVFVEKQCMKVSNSLHNVDACELIETHLNAHLTFTATTDQKKRREREKIFNEWMGEQGDWVWRLAELEKEVEHA